MTAAPLAPMMMTATKTTASDGRTQTHARLSGLGTRERRRRRRTPKCVRKRRRRSPRNRRSGEGGRAGPRRPSPMTPPPRCTRGDRPTDGILRPEPETRRGERMSWGREGVPLTRRRGWLVTRWRRERGERTPTPVLTRSHGAPPSSPPPSPFRPASSPSSAHSSSGQKFKGAIVLTPCSLCRRRRRYDCGCCLPVTYGRRAWRRGKGASIDMTYLKKQMKGTLLQLILM